MGNEGDSDQIEGGRTKKEKLLKNIAIDPILRFNNHLRLPIFSDTLEETPLHPGITADDAMNKLVSSVDQHYSAMLRFRLVDEDRRTFTAERFRFRGAIDDRIFLDGPDHLKTLVEKYMKLLGTEVFFDYEIVENFPPFGQG